MRAEGFFYSLDVLYGGLGIGNLKFLMKRKIPRSIFSSFWSSKPVSNEYGSENWRISIPVESRISGRNPGISELNFNSYLKQKQTKTHKNVKIRHDIHQIIV
jgi:hypothetical protein